MPRDSEGPEFARVTKRLRDANGIPIGTADDNPILDSRVYEVEFADGYKASLAANAIAKNLFAQVDDEGNRFVMLDSIVDHRVNGEELQRDKKRVGNSSSMEGRFYHLGDPQRCERMLPGAISRIFTSTQDF